MVSTTSVIASFHLASNPSPAFLLEDPPDLIPESVEEGSRMAAQYQPVREK